jgi:hypothetical protein
VTKPTPAQALAVRVNRILSNPFTQFAPWIVMSVVEGPQRFELAAGLAFATALGMGIVGLLVGIRLMLLDVVGIVFFGGLIVAGLVVDQDGLHWLERWSGELSNIAVALVALLTIAVRRPFTLPYAREEADPEDWDSAAFTRVSYVLAWVWGAAFVIIAIVGFIGDGPLDQPDNLWTNWIVQVATLILALTFTEWYPGWAAAKAEIAAGERTEPPPSVDSLCRPLSAYLVPAGIVVLAVGDSPWWIGGGMIVAGILITRQLGEDEGSARAEPR